MRGRRIFPILFSLALGLVLLGVVGVVNLVIAAVQARTSLEREAYA